MMTVDQQFNTLNEKLQELIRHYARLQKENDRLKDELQQAQDKEDEDHEKIERLEQQVAVLKLATGEMLEKEKKEFEKKINLYIREIDRAISFLSQ